MAPNLPNGDQQDQTNSQHRWTFRMTENDLDSLSDDSSSSRSSEEEPTLSLKMPSVPPRDVVVIDDDEDDDNDRGNSEAKIDGTTKIQNKGKRRWPKTTEIESVAAHNKRVNNNNGDNNAAFEQVPVLNDLKNYMSSLLDEMKETRGGMLTCLKKELKRMVAEQVASQFELLKRQCSCNHQLLATQETEETTTKSNRPYDACNTSNLRNEDHHHRNKYHSMAIVPVDSSPEEVQVEKQEPEIVLGIKADHSAIRSTKRGKRVAESEDKSGGTRLGLGLGFGFEPGSLSYNHTTPTKYLTLPTRQLDVQGRGVLQGSSSGGSYNMGYFQRLLQTDESSGSNGSRALMGSYLRENMLTSSSSSSPMAGRSGFLQGGGLHQNVGDGIMNSRQFPAGLRISGGGLRFTGGGNNSMMQIPNNNNFQYHGNYRSDHGRSSMGFQDGFQFHK